MTVNSDIIETPKLQRIKEKLDSMDYENLVKLEKILSLYARLTKDNRRKISEFAENLNNTEKGSEDNDNERVCRA